MINPTPDDVARHYRQGRVHLDNLLKEIPVRLSANAYGVHLGADILYGNLMKLLGNLEEMGWEPPKSKDSEFPDDDGCVPLQPPGQSSESAGVPAGSPSTPAPDSDEAGG